APPAAPVVVERRADVALAGRRGAEGVAEAALARRELEVPPERLRVVAGGDIIFGRYLRGGLRFAGGPDPFEHIRPWFREADVAFLNLETPVTDVEPKVIRRYFGFDLKFRAPSSSVAALVAAGIDVVSTANNHAEDIGEEGLADTLRHLGAAGIVAVGTSAEGDPLAPVVFERGGVRIGIIAATAKRNRGSPRPGERLSVAYLTMDQMLAELPPRVRALRESGRVDTVWVSLHWGSGGERPVGKRYQAIAHAVVEAGADLVLGHHAHILQAVEAYGDGFIVYGMGNLIFDMRDLYGRETALFDLEMGRGGDARWRVERLVVRPFLIKDPSSPPAPVTGAEARHVLDPVRRLSRGTHGTAVEYEGDALVWERAAAP
ncbi:MAG: CapA family protein, partial [Myxococcales bacterium]|nr:CapA family protein [Myxococcales bacterium]